MDGRMDIVSFLNQAVSLGVEIAQICDNFNLLELSIDDAVRIVRDFGKRISIQTGFRGHDVKMLEKAILVTNALGGSQCDHTLLSSFYLADTAGGLLSCFVPCLSGSPGSPLLDGFIIAGIFCEFRDVVTKSRSVKSMNT